MCNQHDEGYEGIMTAQELIDNLKVCPPDAKVRLSVENNYAVDRIEEDITRIDCYVGFVVLSND